MALSVPISLLMVFHAFIFFFPLYINFKWFSLVLQQLLHGCSVAHIFFYFGLRARRLVRRSCLAWGILSVCITLSVYSCWLIDWLLLLLNTIALKYVFIFFF